MLEDLLHSALSTGISTGDLIVHFPSGRTERYGNGDRPKAVMRLADAGAVRGMFTDPTLRVPELYMDGRLRIESGDIYDLLEVAMRNIEASSATPVAASLLGLRGLAKAVSRGSGLSQSRRNIAHHYDLDARLYRLFLDRDMQYSCAYFEKPDYTLEQAQLAKKRLIAAKLLIRPGARVLDIGSGWGGMALYLAQLYDVDVTGITLSEEQLAIATRRAEELGLSDRVRFRLKDYRKLDEVFDNVVSVGMLEHVGIQKMSAFMGTVSKVLAPDGVMLLHSIAVGKPTAAPNPFFEKYIFPGHHLPALSEVVAPAEQADLFVRDVEILAMHYADTLREWRRRLLHEREKVLELFDERFLRMWEFYLASAESGFRNVDMHVIQLQLARTQHRVPVTRTYIAEEMDRLKRLEAEIPDYADLHETTARRRMTG